MDDEIKRADVGDRPKNLFWLLAALALAVVLKGAVLVLALTGVLK